MKYIIKISGDEYFEGTLGGINLDIAYTTTREKAIRYNTRKFAEFILDGTKLFCSNASSAVIEEIEE